WNKARLLFDPPLEVLDIAEGPGKAALAEDYITSMAEAENGDLWIGHRIKGCERVSPHNGWATTPVGPPDLYVTAILPTEPEPVIGTFDNQHHVPFVFENTPAKAERSEAAEIKLPSFQATLPSAELRQLLENAIHVTSQIAKIDSTIVPMSDDWRTQGDWI